MKRATVVLAAAAVLLVGAALASAHRRHHHRHPPPTTTITTTATTTTTTATTTTDGAYIALGKVPVGGMQVGATFYGALATSSHYIVSNLRQGGTKTGGAYNGYDDNGVGACGGKYDNLTDQATWAENGSGGNINAGILGNLPCGTKLAIDYHGHRVVAEKGDISDGGCGSSGCKVGGIVQAIDLWWQTAKALCFWNQPDVMTIHVVPSSTPTTSVPVYDSSNPASIATCN